MAARGASSPTRRVEEELLRRGEESELKRELERRKIEGKPFCHIRLHFIQVLTVCVCVCVCVCPLIAAAEAARHRPQLNPHSVEIEQRLPHTTAERLTKTPGRRSASPPRDSNLTFAGAQCRVHCPG